MHCWVELGHSGLPLAFENFFRCSEFLKGFLKYTFLSFFFGLKLSLSLKTMLSSITTLKRYCKATLIMFFNEKNFDDESSR